MKLESGQVAVVTGAASGIGFGLAEALAGRGLSVVLSDVEQAALEKAEARLLASGARVAAIRTDVGEAEQVERLAAVTVETFGRVDVVCNNAGVLGPWAPMWELDLNDWAWTVRVNLWGVIHGIRAFVPLLVDQGAGHVVNTASMGGLMPLPGNAPYNATKHAVVGLTECLRAELDALGSPVGTTVACPGMVTSRLAEAARNRPAELAATAALSGGALHPTPGGPVLEPEQAAQAILAAVETDRLHVLTNPGSAAPAVARVERLLADISDQLVP